MKLSVIVPMLNEESTIARTLDAIRRGAPSAELIVVDGGSSDRSADLARPRCDLLLIARRGRAAQMNAGAARGSGGALAFVHADTIVPPTFGADIDSALADPRIVGGRFDVQLDERGLIFGLIGSLIGMRSRLTSSATGDQAIFVRRAVFESLDGFPDLPICEDLEFARRLKRAGAIASLRSKVTTSARRWRASGIVRTIATMWLIRLLYLAGVSPAHLARLYADIR